MLAAQDKDPSRPKPIQPCRNDHREPRLSWTLLPLQGQEANKTSTLCARRSGCGQSNDLVEAEAVLTEWRVYTHYLVCTKCLEGKSLHSFVD